jgi:hypothetical protein
MDYDDYEDPDYGEGEYEYRSPSLSRSSSEEEDYYDKGLSGYEEEEDERGEPSGEVREGLIGVENVQGEKLTQMDKLLITFESDLKRIGNRLNVGHKISDNFLLRSQDHMRTAKNFINRNSELLALAFVFGLLYTNIQSGINQVNVTQFIDRIKSVYGKKFLPSDIIRYLKILQNSY